MELNQSNWPLTAITHLTVVIATIFALLCPVFATDFLFSEDNQITGDIDQSMSTIEPKSHLPDNKWLNAPLTRLDYVLMKIESTLPDHLNPWALDYIKRTFERAMIGHSAIDPSILFHVGYLEEKGRLLIATDVANVGKPKKPMKEVCEKMLFFMEALYPPKQFGFTWNNFALGILQRDGPSLYQDAVSALAKSAVYIADIEAQYNTDGKNSMFLIKCIKQDDGGPISYFKYSVDNPTPDTLLLRRDRWLSTIPRP